MMNAAVLHNFGRPPHFEPFKLRNTLAPGEQLLSDETKRLWQGCTKLGADAFIHLNVTDGDLAEAFSKEAGENGFDVVLDFSGVAPTEYSLQLQPAGDSLRADWEPA